ncbi:hypothetical protein [Chryseobacterium sp. Leaf394]|uniref:hypothetical protein n=1 Tax=Chryseobacterium sp. Leaf394 TaxID=1736361 RepID=UPI000702327F|nr:hypothetical protein [Chryseobacterium sp. Leaf394]KQS94249.1 hypothetical protein ASG21_18615 [Chryseobacterium sp. Leaf394]
MKNYVIFASALFLAVSCNTNKEVVNKTNNDQTVVDKALIQSISLSESTRGTQRVFKVTPGKIETTKNGVVTGSILSDSEWKTLSGQTVKLNLAEISTYPSPTTKRYSDAALASVITIEKDGKTYSSSEFDSGNPPQQLRDLYMSIQNAAGTKKGGN